MLEYAPNSLAGSNVGLFDHRERNQGMYRPARVRCGLLDRFRASTQAEHRALETQPLLRALLAPDLTRGQYAALLQGLCSFYRPLEAVLISGLERTMARFPADFYRYQPRSGRLQQDLLSLGQTPSPGPAPDLPAELGIDATLGVLYVLEGASQGGRVIAPQIERSLGLTEAQGARFFNGHRQSNSWSLFRQWVSQLEADYLNDPHCDHAVASQSACATFSGLHAHLNHWQGRLSDR